MLIPNTLHGRMPETRAPAEGAVSRQIYTALLNDPLAADSQNGSRLFLEEQLERAAALPCDLPRQPDELIGWMESQALATAERYATYLDGRRAGHPRSYFSCRAHALSFLQGVAPTKLVDGAWLFGLLPNAGDLRFYSLIRTYLEELGDGDPAQNHVVLYQRLLTEQGCEMLPDLSDEHYLQGAIQLALGYHAQAFIPELIGYNLGYEQLPLHLLITAFELNELDIDPYYFTLHVTVDNASTGHARKAVQSLLDNLPQNSDCDAFLERVARGYRLNDLGLGTQEVIESFDLEQELVQMLERKRVFGQQVHSDFCRIEGRTVNEWLARPGQIRGFLQALENRGWIRRHQDPQLSRFWSLIEGSDAQMFGVFSSFEKQLLRDWIAGDWMGDHSAAGPQGRPRVFRPRSRKRHAVTPQVVDPELELTQLRQELAQLPDAARLERMIELMAPAAHSTPAGLLATRMFTAALG
jgi:hypothetical protein